MAKRKSGSRRDGGQEGWQDRMHNIDFSYADELEVQAWYDTASPVWHLCLEELVSEGWSVRITPPVTGDDYWVTGTGKATDVVYLEHSYIIRYPDFEMAILLLYYVVSKWGEEGRLPVGRGEAKGGWLKKEA